MANTEQNNQPKKKKKTNNETNIYSFHINDHKDVLLEVLTRLDARSLANAACVCRLWNAVCTHDALWENLCSRHVSPSARPLVTAMGGYRRLYTVCVRPVLARLSRSRHRCLVARGGERGRARREHLVQLSLSLFSVDCYERLGGRLGSSSSLMFLCQTLNA